ncbi:MAG: CRISPR-associated protein Cas4 [Candidatus Cloacimonetes bacterium]|jgi:CRISPR-associated exonuclease Cas4|nr:CRISPR-associated protein Cas4 [Candidatus Cloacimonadota bacterium]MCK9332773.1 CRISPR-associated protein Cas4 [Candidatus Cloacimonadota bacterium]
MDFQFITPSEVIEYLFCPRFVYFMNVLKINQHEHRRNLVNKGRNIHKLKLVHNKDYIRSRIGVNEKLADVYLSSQQLRLVGKIDEVLFLNNGLAAPLDYKYSFWNNKVFKTHKMQQTLYSLLIEENFGISVEHAYIVYIRSKNHLQPIPVTDAMKHKALDLLETIFEIVNKGLFPNVKRNKRKCEDCTYRNICVS